MGDFLRRKKLRASNFDYSTPGAYFMTICSYERRPIFGAIMNGEMELSEIGKIAEDEIRKSFISRNDYVLDEWVIMPNHIHAIAWIKVSQHKSEFSLIIRGFKSFMTSRYWKMIDNGNVKLWQSCFYDRFIRDEEELLKTREYIVRNPLQWDMDEYRVDWFAKAHAVRPHGLL